MLDGQTQIRSQWVVRMRVDDVRSGNTTGRDLATKSVTRCSVAHSLNLFTRQSCKPVSQFCGSVPQWPESELWDLSHHAQHTGKEENSLVWNNSCTFISVLTSSNLNTPQAKLLAVHVNYPCGILPVPPRVCRFISTSRAARHDDTHWTLENETSDVTPIKPLMFCHNCHLRQFWGFPQAHSQPQAAAR